MRGVPGVNGSVGGRITVIKVGFEVDVEVGVGCKKMEGGVYIDKFE